MCLFFHFIFIAMAPEGRITNGPRRVGCSFLAQLPSAYTEWQETAQRRWTTSGSALSTPSLFLTHPFSQSLSTIISHPCHYTIEQLRFLLTADDKAPGRQESRIILGNIAPSFGSSVSRVTRLFSFLFVCLFWHGSFQKGKKSSRMLKKMKQSY